MARTRQTAKKTTGGSAKRVLLAQPRLFSHKGDIQVGKLASTLQSTRSSADIQHCSLCQDGGRLWQCDERGCERAVCARCVEINAKDLAKLEAPNVKFRCISCHWKKGRKTNRSYMGFTIDGAPILDTFLKVRGIFETATNATVLSPPTLLLHFRLYSINRVAHFTMVDQLLGEYYQDDRLRVVDIPFNVGHEQARDKWDRNAAKLIASLGRYRHVVAFITTHSDPDTGDLWLGQDENNEVCATTVSNWMEIILDPFKAQLAGSFFFLLACGSVVNNPNAFADLRQGLSRLGVIDALAFDAKHLSAVNTVDLLTKVTKSVVIHGFKFTQALEHALRHCSTLGRHTGILHFACDHTAKYSWAHRDYQPWGQVLPLQCMQCGILDPWVSTHIKHLDGYRLECRNKDCGKVDGKVFKEPYAFQVARPANSVLLSVGKQQGGTASGWMKVAA